MGFHRITGISIFSLVFCCYAFTQNSMSAQYIHPLPATADTNIVLPPAWVFGILYGGYTDQSETISRIKEIKAHDYPVDAYWIDSWFWSYADKGEGPAKYIDFVADTTSYPNRKQMWDFMQQNNIKGGFWVWDCILKNGNEKVFDEFNTHHYFRDVYFNSNPWHNNSTSTAIYGEAIENTGSLCGNIDFNNPEAVSYLKMKMKHFFDEGADFIKLDRTTDINTCKAMFEITQELGKETKGRGFILSHTGGTTTEIFKKYPAKWTDDTRSDWTVEAPDKAFDSWVPNVALKENIARYTDPGLETSKIPFLTNDLGGFDIGKLQVVNEELYIRWLQFSMFCPITEVFSQPENPTANLAWLYSPRADSIFRFYSHLRLQLFPYLYTYALQSRITGQAMLRQIPGQLYEFLLGNELLVAPVYEKGATSRKVFLPVGKWVNYWTGQAFDGGLEIMDPAPLCQVPLFVKAGSVIPFRMFNSSVESGNNNTLLLDVYPLGNSIFTLVEDDGVSNDYLQGIYASTTIEVKRSGKKITITINPVKGSFEGMKPERNWILQIHCPEKPAKVIFNNRIINFEFDAEKNLASFQSGDYQKGKSLSFVIILQ